MVAVHGNKVLDSSRCTVSGENAGRQMAMYSAPSATRRAVAHPFAGRGDDRLAGGDVEDAALVLDAQDAAQHDGDFLELGPLSRFLPSSRRHHPRDAHGPVAGVDAAREFVNLLRLVPGGGDNGRLLDQSWHGQKV